MAALGAALSSALTAGASTCDPAQLDRLGSDALKVALGTLVREAEAGGLTIFLPDSAFVGEDEIAILTRMAEFQRPSQSRRWVPANPFQQALKLCAQELLACEGRRLPLRPALPRAYVDRFACLRIEHPGGSRDLPKQPRWYPSAWDGVTEPEPGSLKARAREVVRRHTLATTAQFVAAGVSSQYLSRLAKRGYIEKVRHGVYRLPESPGKTQDI